MENQSHTRTHDIRGKPPKEWMWKKTQNYLTKVITKTLTYTNFQIYYAISHIFPVDNSTSGGDVELFYKSKNNS